MSFRDSFRFSFSPISQNKSGTGSKSSSIRSRGLKFETLENRELLSVTSPVSDPVTATDNGAAVAETQSAAPQQETDVVVMEADGHVLDRNLGVPDVTATVLSNSTVSLTWNTVSGALYYDVWKIISNDEHIYLGNTVVASFSDTNPSAGVNTYAVRAMTTNTFSDYKLDVTVTVSSSMNLQGTFNADKTSIMLTWNGVSKADRYTVTWDLHDDLSSDTGSISLSSAYTYYDMSFPTRYETGYFTVYAYDVDYNVLGYSALTVNRSDVDLTTPKITKYEQVGKNVELEWNAVNGAAKYIVSRIDSAGNEVALNDNGTTDTHFTVKNASVGYNTYTVRAVSGTNVSDYQRDITVNVTFGVTAVTAGNSVKISWDAVSEAAYYTVWYTDNFGSENWITVNKEKHLTDLSLTLALPSLESRTYGVRAYRGNGEYMGYGVASWFKTNLATPTVTTSLESFGDGSACLLTWTAVANAKKYEVWDITGTHKSLGIVSGTSFLHLDAAFGKTVYAVRALHDLAFSDYQRNVVCDLPFQSELEVVELAGGDDVLRFTWEKVTGAATYKVSIDNGAGGWTVLRNGITATRLDIDDPGVGSRIYKVEACDSTGTVFAQSTDSFFYSEADDLKVHRSGERAFTVSWTGGDEGSRVQVLRNGEIVARFTKSELQKDTDGRYFWVDNTLPEIGTGPFYYTIRALADASDDTVFFDSEPCGPVALDAIAKPVVEVEQTGSRTIRLTWDDVPNTTHYEIWVDGTKVEEVKDESGILFYDYDYTVVGTGPKTFEFVVKAVNDDAWASSKAESFVWFAIPSTVTAALDSVTSTAKITWTDNANVDTVDYDIVIRQNGKVVGEWRVGNAAKAGYDIPIYLYGSGSFTFAVRAVVEADEGPLSASSNAVVIGGLAPATGVGAARVNGTNNVKVTWQGGDGGSSVQILRNNAVVGTVAVRDLQIEGTRYVYTDSSVTQSGSYQYKIRSVDGTGSHVDSEASTLSFTWFGTPGTPMAVAYDSTTARVAWIDLVNDHDKVRYRVTAYSDSDDSVVGSVISSNTSVLFSGLTTGRSYYFTVCAVDATLDDVLGPESMESNSIALS